jgi:hypothetical protein
LESLVVCKFSAWWKLWSRFRRFHEFRKFVCVLRQGLQPKWQLSVEAVIEEHVKVAGAVWVGLHASKRTCCSGG